MSTKEIYKQKMEAEMELVQANLEVLKAKAKSAAADAQISFSKEIEALEKNYTTMQKKLNELADASENTWEHIKKEIESTWETVSAYAKKIPENISEIKKNLK
jgi:hypothetical protein